MKNMRYSCLTIIALLVSLQVTAQAVKIDFDKKIIFTDSLNLPRNISASTLITLLPDLLQRPGYFILSNYDVTINDMSVGQAIDVALLQLQIVDIEKIEVNESPVSSYQNNGQGGSINIELRTSANDNRSTWGSAGILAKSDVDVAPQLNVGYKKNNFSIRGVMLGETYDASHSLLSQTLDNNKLVSQSYADINNRFRTQLLRAYMQFDITRRDVLKFNLSERYTYSTSEKIVDHDEHTAVTNKQRATNLQAMLDYTHKLGHGELNATVEYNYTPTHNERNDYITYDDNVYRYDYDSKLNTNNLSGKLEYKTQLYHHTAADGTENSGDITVGSNFNSNFGDEKTDIIDRFPLTPEETWLSPQNNTYYVMPYITLKGNIGRLRLKIRGEFQHFKYDIKRMDKPYSVISNDFTGKFMAEWHFTPARNMRLILDRKLQRPGSDQLYPFRLYDINQHEYVQGNPNLTPMMSHEIALDYLDNYKWDDGHNLTLNAGVSYNHITDIINGSHVQSAATTGTLGAILHQLTYENNGRGNVASANLMALCSYKAFTLSMVGNVYHKMVDGDDHCTYYNLSFHPQFNLNDGWNGGVRIVYYSSVHQANGKMGDCASASMTVGRAWKNFFFYFTEDVSILKNSKDVTYSGTKRTETESQMAQVSQNIVGIGMKYTF